MVNLSAILSKAYFSRIFFFLSLSLSLSLFTNIAVMYTSNKMLSPREITNDRKHFIDNLDRIWTMQPNGTRSFVNPNRGSLPRVAEYFRPIRGRFRECVACRRRRQAVERREILKACGTLALVHKNLPPYWLFYSLTYIHSEIHATRTTPDALASAAARNDCCSGWDARRKQ